jgi:hypothetical protein
MAKRGKSPRAQVPVRIPEALRARIEKAAKETGQSMNAEIIDRLEGSFGTEDRLGGPQLVELLEAMASAMKITGQTAALAESDNEMNQGQWLSLPYAFDQATKAALAVLKYHRPKGERGVPRLDRSLSGDHKKRFEEILPILENLGERVAQLELRDREEEK